MQSTCISVTYKKGPPIAFLVSLGSHMLRNQFLDERTLSLCLSQIVLHSLQALQALTKLHQCLRGGLALVLNSDGGACLPGTDG